MELLDRAISLESRVSTICISNTNALQRKEELFEEIKDIIRELENKILAYNDLSDATNLMNKIADTRVKKALDFTVRAVNDALSKVFAHDYKEIEAEISSHLDTYPQLNIVLKTHTGKRRNLKTQEGNGLSQIISVLSTICLLYISGGRRFMVLDEVMNGLHPDALKLMEELLTVFEDKLGFQFIIINHGYTPNRGIVYHIAKRNKTSVCHKMTYIGIDGHEPIEEVQLIDETELDPIESNQD